MMRTPTDSTQVLKDISVGGSAYPNSFANVGGTLYFNANDGSTGRELWKSNGTGSGTVFVKDLSPGTTSGHCGSSPRRRCLRAYERGRDLAYVSDAPGTFEMRAVSGRVCE